MTQDGAGRQAMRRTCQPLVSKMVAGTAAVSLALARRLLTVATGLVSADHHCFWEDNEMTWTKPEFEVVELGMEVGAYAGNA